MSMKVLLDRGLLPDIMRFCKYFVNITFSSKTAYSHTKLGQELSQHFSEIQLQISDKEE